MQIVEQHEVSPALAALFDLSGPTVPRAMNVLEGSTRGMILADDPASPRWASRVASPSSPGCVSKCSRVAKSPPIGRTGSWLHAQPGMRSDGNSSARAAASVARSP